MLDLTPLGWLCCKTSTQTKTWKCLGLGPSNLERMLVLTSRWHWGRRSRSQWPLVQNMLITRQCVGLGPSNIIGMFLMIGRWAEVLDKVTMAFRTASLLAMIQVQVNMIQMIDIGPSWPSGLIIDVSWHVKISENLNLWSWLKICLKSTYPMEFCNFQPFLLWGKKGEDLLLFFFFLF